MTKPVTTPATVTLINAYMETTPLPAIGSKNIFFDTVNIKAIDRYINPKTQMLTLVVPVGRALPTQDERVYDEFVYNS